MDFKYKQLEHELSALSRVFGELGARLSEVAKDVTSPGVTPPEKLIEQISTARTNFDNVRGAVHGHATAMLVSPLPKIGELVSVTAIDTLLKASAAAEENKLSIDGERDRALNILSRVLAITHKETAEFKPLQECQAKVDELRIGISKTAWPHRHPEIDSVTGLKHPVTALLSFVENLDTLEDDRWIALETTITETFGKPLFVAASRGKLVVPKADKPVAAAPVEKKLVAEKAPEKPAAPPAAHVDKKVTSPAPAPVAATPQKPPAPPVAAEKKDAAQTVVAPPQPPVPAPTPTPAVTPITVNATPAAPAAIVQTPAAASPVAPAAPAPIVAATPTIPAPTTPAPAVPAAAAPAPTAPAPQRTPAAAPAPAAVTQTPATVVPASSTPPPAPIAAAPTAVSTTPTPVAAAPAPAASAPTPPVPPAAAVTNAPTAQNSTIPSLTALATATEPATDRKPAAPHVETIDKQRKEPRLAAPAPQPMAKSESKSPEAEMVEQNALAADGSQRPQRWGFWRGNR
jgi:hypothetical protein